MSVATGDDQIDGVILDETKQGLRQRYVDGPDQLVGAVDVMTLQKLHDIFEVARCGGFLTRLAEFNDGDAFCLLQERQRIHDGAARSRVSFQATAMRLPASDVIPDGTRSIGRPALSRMAPGSTEP
jgi:hypothetical protein